MEEKTEVQTLHDYLLWIAHLGCNSWSNGHQTAHSFCWIMLLRISWVLVCPFTHSFLKCILHIHCVLSAVLSLRCIQGLTWWSSQSTGADQWENRPLQSSASSPMMEASSECWGDSEDGHQMTWLGSEPQEEGTVAWNNLPRRLFMGHRHSCGNPTAMVPGRDTGRKVHVTWWDLRQPWPGTELTLAVLCPRDWATLRSLKTPCLFSKADWLSRSSQPQACFLSLFAFWNKCTSH